MRASTSLALYKYIPYKQREGNANPQWVTNFMELKFRMNIRFILRNSFVGTALFSIDFWNLLQPNQVSSTCVQHYKNYFHHHYEYEVY